MDLIQSTYYLPVLIKLMILSAIRSCTAKAKRHRAMKLGTNVKGKFQNLVFYGMPGLL